MTHDKEGIEATQEQEIGAFPPRRKLHPSNKLKMVQLFYQLLIVLFLLLTAGMIVWGVQFLE